MERSKLYAKIKEYNLEEEIKNLFGRNFTQVKSSDLEKVIANAMPKTPSCNVNNTCATKRLIEVLQKKRILLNSEVDYILG